MHAPCPSGRLFSPVQTPHSELVFTYHAKEWADDNVSTVTIQLEALTSAKTKLTLTQTDVPHDDKYGTTTPTVHARSSGSGLELVVSALIAVDWARSSPGNHYQEQKVEGGWPQFFWTRINKVLGYASLEL